MECDECGTVSSVACKVANAQVIFFLHAGWWSFYHDKTGMIYIFRQLCSVKATAR
jgi:hypothetical protein